MKTTRTGLDYDWAVPGDFDGFFSFPITKGGYSGVAVYTRSQTASAIKAEEGLTGTLQPRNPLKSEERVSSKYPFAHEMNLMSCEDGSIPSELTHLDAEGRALVLDFGLFVLINVYCPIITSEARTPFRMNFLYLLEERVRILIQEGREVVVVGDINICSLPLDHAEGHLTSNASKWFDERPDRVWLRNWLDYENGPMCDVVRKFWPERKGMFTCQSGISFHSTPNQHSFQAGTHAFLLATRTTGRELTTF
jgi:AP endonuclease-2